MKCAYNKPGISLFVLCFLAFTGINVSVASDSGQPEGKQLVKEVCFKNCHTKKDFTPQTNNAKQWEYFLDGGLHSTVFSKIPWENPEQKEKVLNFLKNNASDTKRKAKGVGVWD